MLLALFLYNYHILYRLKLIYLSVVLTFNKARVQLGSEQMAVNMVFHTKFLVFGRTKDSSYFLETNDNSRYFYKF